MERLSRPPRLILVLVAVGLVSGSCSGTDAAQDAPVVRIAFLQDLSVAAHVDLVSPSFLAFEQSVQEGTAGLDVRVEVVQSDTENDPARALELANQVAGDPSYILAVVAPFWRAPLEVATTLAEAGVPIVSLSPLTPSPDGSSRRFVPDQMAQGVAMAALVERAMDDEEGPACVIGEETNTSLELAGILDAELPPTVPRQVVATGDVAAAVAQVRDGCALTVWTGSADGADGLAEAFRNAGITRDPPIDIASDALKTVIPGAAVDGDRAAVGSLTCPCVDVSL